jgi:hypothetical protein
MSADNVGSVAMPVPAGKAEEEEEVGDEEEAA